MIPFTAEIAKKITFKTVADCSCLRIFFFGVYICVAVRNFLLVHVINLKGLLLEK
jgi:hypothetical protein